MVANGCSSSSHFHGIQGKKGKEGTTDMSVSVNQGGKSFPEAPAHRAPLPGGWGGECITYAAPTVPKVSEGEVEPPELDTRTQKSAQRSACASPLPCGKKPLPPIFSLHVSPAGGLPDRPHAVGFRQGH